MYTVHIPRSWVVAEGRLIFRMINRTTRETKSIRIFQGKPLNIFLHDLPSDAPGDVYVWISNAGGNGNITERVNLASLKKIPKIKTLFFSSQITAEKAKEIGSLTKVANALRWIQPTNSDDTFRLSHRIINDFNRITPAGHEIIDKIFNELDAFQDINDGSEIANQITYIWAMQRIMHRSAQVLNPSETFSATVSKAIGSKQGILARDLLEEIRRFNTLPSVKAISSCLESLILDRRSATLSFAGLRKESATAQRIKKTGALAGVSSFGDCDHRSAVPLPSIDYPGIGVDLKTRKDTGRVTVIYSANPSFLRAYLMRLVFYISLFPEYDYHFHLIAPPEESADLASLLLDTYITNQTIRKESVNVDHISFSFSEVPYGVSEAVSYYAAARFLVAYNVMRTTGAAIWIQDVDLFPTGDSSIHLPQLEKADVSLYVSNFLRGVFPWTRYLAGNVYVSNTELGRKFLLSTSEYLSEWVAVPDSWTVDQNAMTYAIDSCGPNLKLGNMRTFKIPFHQSKLATRIEGMKSSS